MNDEIRGRQRWLALGVLLTMLTSTPGQGKGVDRARGQEILKQFREVNRYWLVGPPPAVQNFSYVLQRIGGAQEFDVRNPQKTPRARLQGITYAAMVHQLGRNPQSATVQGITEEDGRVRLDLALDPPVRGACGNGVENSWHGYHSIGGNTGFLVLNSKLWVPLEAGIGRLRETFGEFVAVDEQHYVPLAIRVKIGDDTEYDWRFRVYEPGLWLFDESRSGERRIAWVERVKVNSADAKLEHATTASLARAASEKSGEARLQAFLEANRHWLLPSLEARRGFIYEYRQEAPYLERVLMDNQGNLIVRLEASKDYPDYPTRQRLWLADGRSYSGTAEDRFVRLEGSASNSGNPGSMLLRDRVVQHLAMGLALDCALTRLAREPDTFWAEIRPVPEQPDKYLLVLHSKRDARLFTGTMLAFTSWSFMHDVKYDRSEILCAAATHRPLEEKDYSGKTELKGRYVFEEWLSSAGGAVPGCIRAVVPYEKNGQDQSLEMDARFQVADDIWLLDQVKSHFRSEGGGSTGTVTRVSAAADGFPLIRDLLQKAEMTGRNLAAIEASLEGGSEIRLPSGEWSAAPVKAAWTDKARESARGEDRKMQTLPIIGIHSARIIQTVDESLAIELDGISTASWKEFQTHWKVSLLNATGRTTSSAATNLTVRAENAPAAFLARLELPRAASLPERVFIEGTVQRMTGAYHGHGVWFRLARDE
jgi:hypothetical protein